jgi:hypothetical protein
MKFEESRLTTFQRFGSICSQYPEKRRLNGLPIFLGLDESTKMGTAIKAATDLGVIVPSRKRQKRLHCHWVLAIEYANSNALYFNWPSPEVLFNEMQVPGAYIQIAKNLGQMHISQSSGYLLWPAHIREVANDIAFALSESGDAKDVIPFYDQLTGDFDVWLDRDFETTFSYNHETRDCELYTIGGFHVWMERTFELCSKVA